MYNCPIQSLTTIALLKDYIFLERTMRATHREPSLAKPEILLEL